MYVTISEETVPSFALKVTKLLPCLEGNASRPSIDGIGIEIAKDYGVAMTMVATNGHALMHTSVGVMVDVEEPNKKVIWATKACKALKKFLSENTGTLRLEIGANCTVASFPSHKSLIIAHVDSEFPQWRNVLPSKPDFANAMEFDKGQLQKLVNETISASGVVDTKPRIRASGGARCIRTDVSSVLKFKYGATTDEVTKSEEVSFMKVEWTPHRITRGAKRGQYRYNVSKKATQTDVNNITLHSGETDVIREARLTVGVNAQVLKKVLLRATGPVQIIHNGDAGSVVTVNVCNDDIERIVMPMRV